MDGTAFHGVIETILAERIAAKPSPRGQTLPLAAPIQYLSTFLGVLSTIPRSSTMGAAHLTSAESAHIRNLYAVGISVPDIARRVGRSHHSIYRLLADHGLWRPAKRPARPARVKPILPPPPEATSACSPPSGPARKYNPFLGMWVEVPKPRRPSPRPPNALRIAYRRTLDAMAEGHLDPLDLILFLNAHIGCD